MAILGSSWLTIYKYFPVKIVQLTLPFIGFKSSLISHYPPGLGEMITTSLPPDAPVPDVDCPVKHERKARSGQNKVIILESILDYSRSSFQRN